MIDKLRPPWFNFTEIKLSNNHTKGMVFFSLRNVFFVYIVEFKLGSKTSNKHYKSEWRLQPRSRLFFILHRKPCSLESKMTGETVSNGKDNHDKKDNSWLSVGIWRIKQKQSSRICDQKCSFFVCQIQINACTKRPSICIIMDTRRWFQNCYNKPIFSWHNSIYSINLLNSQHLSLLRL